MNTRFLMIALALAFSVHAFAYDDNDPRAFRWLNYETGEELPDSLVSESARSPIYTYTNDDNGCICEMTIKYARIQKTFDYDAVCMKWELPDLISTWLTLGEPEVPYADFLFLLDSECDSVNIYVTDAEYKEFDYALPPNRPVNVVCNKDNVIESFRTPPTEGKGILPSKIIQNCRLQKYENGTTFVQVYLFPVRYDYDRQVVRAYSYIKMRVDPVYATGARKPTAKSTSPTGKTGAEWDSAPEVAGTLLMRQSY